MIDSGSRDGSLAIARARGRRGARDPARRVRPRPHAQPRRRAHAAASSICLPHPGRDAGAGLAGRATARRSRSPTTSAPRSARTCRGRTRRPMIARELTEFFADVRAATARPASSAPGDPTFLSNVNAVLPARRAGRRSASPTSPTPRTRRSAARWLRGRLARRPTTRARRSCTRTTTRRSSSCAATSTSTAACARRSATSSGSACARRVRDVRGARRAPTGAGCASRASAARRAARWTAARRVHHSGRKVFSALGSRADRLPAPRPARALARGRATAVAGAAPSSARRRPCTASRRAARTVYDDDRARRARGRRRRCSTPCPGMADARAAARRGRDPAVPARQRRAHTIFQLLSRLERRATRLDLAARPVRLARDEWPARRARQHARVLRARSRRRCSRASTLVRRRRRASPPAGRPSTRCCGSTDCRARAYLVQDHEPEFFATSAESLWAERDLPLRACYCIAGEPVAARPVRRPLRRARPARSSSASTTTSTARAPVERRARHDRLLRARRDAAARRAARRAGARRSCTAGGPDVRFVLFGDREPLRRAVPVRAPRRRHARSSSPGRTRRRRSGSALSLTNYSLIPQEMLACGLPCVELGGRERRERCSAPTGRSSSRRSTRSRSPTRSSGCSTTAERERRSAAGREFVRPHTWDRAAEQVERGLRTALRGAR